MSKIIDEYKTELILFFILIAILVIMFMYKKTENKKYVENDLGIIEETEEFDITYKENEYKVITMETVDLMTLYHKDFMYLLSSDPVSSWDKLSASAKKNYKDKDDYVNYIKSIVTNNTKTSTMVSYKEISNIDTNNKYEILDSENVKIVVEDHGIWRYEIDFIKKI